MKKGLGKSLFICVGSNLSEALVRSTTAWLKEQLEVTECSSIYTTPPCHGSGPAYYNCVVKACTLQDIESLDARFKAFELSKGRDAEARKEGRVPVDIDIVTVDDTIVRPRDYRQNFFKIGFSELTCPIVEH